METKTKQTFKKQINYIVELMHDLYIEGYQVDEFLDVAQKESEAITEEYARGVLDEAKRYVESYVDMDDDVTADEIAQYLFLSLSEEIFDEIRDDVDKYLLKLIEAKYDF
jgi:hypothetical protein